MVSGLTIRSAGRSVPTDTLGNARLSLPAGRQILSVTGIGFKPTEVAVTVVADSIVTVKVEGFMANVALRYRM